MTFTVTKDGTIHDGNCWAFAELGLYHLEHGEPVNAVGPLQKAINLKPCSLVFELLAEAYAARKSFAAAVLCFSKSIELGSDHEAFVKYRFVMLPCHKEYKCYCYIVSIGSTGYL